MEKLSSIGSKAEVRDRREGISRTYIYHHMLYIVNPQTSLWRMLCAGYAGKGSWRAGTWATAVQGAGQLCKQIQKIERPLP